MDANAWVYSTDVNFIASQALARGQQKPAGTDGGDKDGEKSDAMEALEREARAPVGFVAASTGPQTGNIKPPTKPEEPIVASNPDAIDLDAMEE